MAPQTPGKAWPDVLEQGHRVLLARLEEDDGEVEKLQSLAAMLGMAARYAAEGNLYHALIPLEFCETLAQRL